MFRYFASLSFFLIIVITPAFGQYSDMIVTEDDEKGSNIKSMNSYIDEIGYTHLLGTIQNLGEKTAKYVKVIGTVYDQQGKIIGTGFMFAEPNDLYNKRSGTFDVVIANKLNSNMIKSYAIHAVSQEYGLIYDKPVTDISDEVNTN